MKTLENAIEKLCGPLLDEYGLELVDLEVKRQGSKLWLRLFVDRKDRGESGITVDECGDFNTALGRLLDVHELIAESYLLEVSSPGVNRRIRKLRDFKRCLGEKVKVELKERIGGRKSIKGVIAAADEEGITVMVGEERFVIPHDSISRANLEYRLEQDLTKP